MLICFMKDKGFVRDFDIPEFGYTLDIMSAQKFEEQSQITHALKINQQYGYSAAIDFDSTIFAMHKEKHNETTTG